MISDEDKEYITDLLIELVAPVESPRQTLTAPFLGTTFPEHLRQGSPRELVIDAVRLCLIDAWSHQPPWLVLLLEIFNLPADDQKVAEIVREIRQPRPAGPDPLDATVLNNGSPFVDRAPLRFHLRRLATPAANNQPILVVSGTDKSGKSYSSNYIEHFSYARPAIITYRYEFDAEFGMEIGPEQVARDLVSMMGRPPDSMPKPETNQKLYARQLAVWVLAEAAQTPAQHWFILDNFKGDKLRPDTRELLVALSDRITTGVFPQRCRLILIGFDRANLTVDPGKVEEESIVPCKPNDIEEAVREILLEAPGPVPLSRVSPVIVSGLPTDQGRMSELNLRLRALLHAVRAVRDIIRSVEGANYEEVLLKMLDDLPPGQERMKELRRRLEALRETVVEL